MKQLKQQRAEAYALWVKISEGLDKGWETKQSQLEGATERLRNLGFDDKLIKELLKDPAKAKSANQVLQDILRLIGEDEAKPKQDKAGKE